MMIKILRSFFISSDVNISLLYISSHIPDNPEDSLKEFLPFVSGHIKKNLPITYNP